MDKLAPIFSSCLNTIIYVCTFIGTVAGVLSITKCLSKSDFHGAVRSFLMSLLGIALIFGYPMAVQAIKGMIGS